MNMFLHDIADARIERGDTLLDPKHVEGGAKKRLKTFDMVLANPPFSLSPWGYDVWSKGDPWGRDTFGCPPASYGDLAFVEHMIASLNDSGRMAVVVPHGVLFRGAAEGAIRRAIIEADLVDAVIGLGPNLFYGASIPAAILLLTKKKPASHKKKLILVNGAEELVPGKAQNALSDENVKRLARTVLAFVDEERFAKVVTIQDLEENEFNLNLARYVQLGEAEAAVDLTVEINRLNDLTAARGQAETKVQGFLKELGYVG